MEGNSLHSLRAKERTTETEKEKEIKLKKENIKTEMSHILIFISFILCIKRTSSFKLVPVDL
jgi:hypothetical protein